MSQLTPGGLAARLRHERTAAFARSIGRSLLNAVLTLVIVPVMYDVFDKLILKFSKKKKKDSIDDLMMAEYELKPMHEGAFDPSHV